MQYGAMQLLSMWLKEREIQNQSEHTLDAYFRDVSGFIDFCYEKKIELETGGVDFYDGAGDDPAFNEAESWYDAIVNDTDPLVKPEQALVVTQILEGIYESAETGQPVFL